VTLYKALGGGWEEQSVGTTTAPGAGIAPAAGSPATVAHE